MLCGWLRNRIHTLLRDHVRLQSLVVILIYAQIGCALIGSLGALYNGVLLINLAIALFALVAIENTCQNLCRTYMVLLFCAILLDISWFILFSKEIWNISSELYQARYIFSVKLTMAMEIAGFVVRLSSSLLWFQIYRLGASSLPRHPYSDLRNSFLDPPPHLAGQGSLGPGSRSEEILGDNSILETAYYTPLFDDGQRNINSPEATQVNKHHSTGNILEGFPSFASDASRNKSPLSSRSLESLDSGLQ